VIYTIPVVVHVVYNTEAQDLSKQIIDDQIARLNIDYRRLNDQSSTVSDFVTFEADTGIQFVYATQDPNGNPFDGIHRVHTSTTSFPAPDSVDFDDQCAKTSMGGTDIWDRSKYMNIWICNFEDGILGYAQLPGGPANVDGIAITTSAFGAGSNTDAPYNKGRTLTHEVGHWLNLDHPWGDNEGDCNEDDGVSDTPQTDGPNYYCPLTHVSCSDLNMVQNYMDYTDDPCMTLFTIGQANRMRVELASGGRRASVTISFNGTALGTDGNYVSPFDPSITTSLNEYNGATTVNYNGEVTTLNEELTSKQDSESNANTLWYSISMLISLLSLLM